MMIILACISKIAASVMHATHCQLILTHYFRIMLRAGKGKSDSMLIFQSTFCSPLTFDYQNFDQLLTYWMIFLSMLLFWKLIINSAFYIFNVIGRKIPFQLTLQLPWALKDMRHNDDSFFFRARETRESP